MKEQDYNNLLIKFSTALAPINQLLYEILIIITIYIYLERINSSANDLSFRSDNSLSDNSLSVIIIFIILAISIDLFIWYNPIQTFLFGAILGIYIRYKMSNMQLISSFVNMTGEYANIEKLALSREDIAMKEECQKPRIPEMLDLPYDRTDIKPYGIMAYDKTETSINSINDAYKSSNPPEIITDSIYAQIMLNELYKTSQYKNNHPPNEIDASLGNDIHLANLNNQSMPLLGDNELLDSFRNPKTQFLDNQWLSSSSKKKN